MFCPKCRVEYPADWKACPKDATTLLKSEQIGKYAIDGILGVGGMGAVYRATNPDTKGRVAIKVMNPDVATSESMRQRFQREAAAVAALRTSHVVKVYDFGTETDGTLYLVMELLDGHALREEIEPEPSAMDLSRVQMVMDGALRGLAAAHKAGIVHRDLKPENIFVADTDDGEVPKLLDFGIARVATKGQNLTHTGSLMGTAPYMATEQVGAGGEVGPWTDVYAMGAILYELLAGVPAFGGMTITDVLQKVLRSDMVPLTTVRPGLPDEVYALIARCLDADPTRRPQDADAMRAALAAARLVPPGAAVPPPYRTKPGKQKVELAIAETEGRETPLPPELSPPAPRPSAAQPSAAQPSAARPPAADAPARGARRRAPFVVGGLVLAGIAAVVVAKLASHHAEDPPAQAATGPVIDASTPAAILIDATAAPVVDAAPDPNAGMVAIPAGRYRIGVGRGVVADALTPHDATIRALWIDRGEMTLAELRAAVPNLPAETTAKTVADAPTAPARFVSWATASAACQAFGKRLPTEAEWEIAARTTPQDAARARLRRTNTEADLTAAGSDCSDAGLCDMLGGLREWTSDAWPNKRGQKVIRGASYRTPADGQLDSIHARLPIDATAVDNEIGFRCVRSAP